MACTLSRLFHPNLEPLESRYMLSVVPFDDSILAPTGLEATCALPDLAVFNVKNYGARGDGFYDDTQAIRSTITAATAAGGGIIYLPTGTYAVCPQAGDSSTIWKSVFHITSSNLVFIGDGAESTQLRGFMTGLADPVTHWDVTGDSYVKISRFSMFSVDSSAAGSNADIANVQFRSLTIDGGAGYTGNFSVGGNTITGDGWDMTHKAIMLNGSHIIANTLVFNCDIKNWRGEEVYAGGNNIRTVSIVNSHISGTNASAVSCSGNVLIDHSTIGGSEVGQRVYNGVENFCFTGQATVVRDSVISWASSNGIAFLGYPESWLTVERSSLNQNRYGILFSEASHNVQVSGCTFTNNVQSMVTSVLGLYPELAGHTGFDHFTITGNTFDRSGAVILPQEYSSTGRFPSLSIVNNTITNGVVLDGGFMGDPTGWAGFIVDNNTLGTGAKDITGGYNGKNIALWTRTGRTLGTGSTAVKVDDFSTNVTTSIAPKTDLTFLNANQTTGNHYAVIDPLLLSGYPIGFTTRIVAGQSNWVLKADATWNDFTADVPVGADGVTIRLNQNGVFSLVQSNGAPEAGNDSYTTSEDALLSIAGAGILANDSTLNGVPLSAVLVAGPGHGSLTLNLNGSFNYTPSANYNGTDSFTYRANDGTLTSNLATVLIVVQPVNDPPLAGDDSYVVDVDKVLTVAAGGVLTNDSDGDGNPLAPILVAGPSHGALTLNANGSFTYTPTTGYAGADSFTYRASDGTLSSTTATVSITVRPATTPPQAANDSYAVDEDTTLMVSGAGVLSNDSANNGGVLGAVLVTGPSHGSVTLSSNGSFVYTPFANYNGTDTFTYRASAGGLSSLVASVAITVRSVNDAPTGAHRSITTLEERPYIFAVSDFGFTDGSDLAANGMLAVRITTLPTIGALTNNGVALTAGQFVSVANISAGKLKYTPVVNGAGVGYASFTFQVQDNGGIANGGINLDPFAKTLTINVTAVNDAPLGTNKTVTTLEDVPFTFASQDFGFIDAKDSPSNALLAVKIASLPKAGQLMNNGVAVYAGQFISSADIASGRLKFVPAANGKGLTYASFTFQVQDDGGTAAGGINLDPSAKTMIINVTSINDAPTGASKTIATLEDKAYTLAVADFGFKDAADSPANTLMAVRISALPAAGSLTDNGVAVAAGQFISVSDISSGKVKYTPASNGAGANYASFSFQVQDNGGTAAGGLDLDPVAKTITINVTPVNDAPTGRSKTVTTLVNSPYIFATADFGFADANDSSSNVLGAVKISSLPAAGKLTDNGVAVKNGQLVSLADVVGGKLKFTPATGASGSDYARFSFQVQDNGGTTNGGINLDPIAKTMTVDVIMSTYDNFLKGLYHDVLGRSPTTTEIVSWTVQMNNSVPRDQVVSSIWTSAEHRGIQVDGFYQSLLHRAADSAGRQAWINRMLGGMTEEAVMSAFIDSDEYKLLNPLNSSFVVAVYRDILGSTVDATTEASWVLALDTNLVTALQVAQAVIDSHQRHLNLVDSYYHNFLGHDPDPIGEAAWTEELDSKALDDQSLAVAFLSSAEYYSKAH